MDRTVTRRSVVGAMAGSAALAAAGIPADPRLLATNLSGTEAARLACHQLLAGSSAPTGCFALPSRPPTRSPACACCTPRCCGAWGGSRTRSWRWLASLATCSRRVGAARIRCTTRPVRGCAASAGDPSPLPCRRGSGSLAAGPARCDTRFRKRMSLIHNGPARGGVGLKPARRLVRWPRNRGSDRKNR